MCDPRRGNFDCASIACCEPIALDMAYYYARKAGMTMQDVLMMGYSLDDLMEWAEAK